MKHKDVFGKERKVEEGPYGFLLTAVGHHL